MKIEGMPDGWELVRIGSPIVGVDWVVNRDGTAVLFEVEHYAKNWPIIRKIEKPKQYRPFANAAEFKPHRDRWIIDKSNPDSCVRIDGCGNKGVTIQGNAHDFSRLFDERTFDDGTPFGIEVTE